MPEQYYEEETIDLKGFILTYIKKWKLLCLISVIVAIIVFLGIKLVVNKNNLVYVAEFEFTYPGYENNTLPNGKQFRYQEIITEGIVKKAIASDSAFSGFSAADIVGGNIITISQKNNIIKDQNGNETEEPVLGMYYFTASAKYFKSATIAQSFLSAILKAAAEEVKDNAATIDYEFYLVSFDRADTFAAKIEYLTAQKNYITDIYSNWIKQYGDQLVIKGISINRYRENANLAFTDKVNTELINELQRRQYVLEKTASDELACKLQIEIYEEQIEDIDKKIEGLTQALEKLREGDKSSDSSSLVDQSNETIYYNQIASLTEQRVDIEREINHVEIQIKNLGLDSERQEFLAKLETVKADLAAETKVLSDTVAPAVYDEKTVAELEPAGFMVQGKKNAILFAGIAFVGMYLVVGFFCFLLKEDEEEKKEKTNNK